MTLSTHVLDTAAGRPASGVPVVLERAAAGGWSAVASAVTDADGRARDLPASAAGRWRLVFDTAALSTFFPSVTIELAVTDPGAHLHVPLLLAPYGYSTYRGS